MSAVSATRDSHLRPETYLPSPPTDAEKYWYLGRQHRWLLVAQAAAFGLIAYSVFRFSTSTPELVLFLIPMSLYCITLLVSLLSSGRKKRVTRIDHEFRVTTWRPNVYPTVDVFLPTAGEPLEVLENTYRHVANLSWPSAIEVYVLDDAASPAVRDLAVEYGFNYCSRPDRGRLKKAGNLRYGYDLSRGDLIAVFDADFVPRPDYLFELVPYFDEPTTGIVQSPQFFDAVKGMHWLQRCAGATQELFYRWIQPARDRSNAAICVGTCAIYRRSALEKSGGFAQIGHSEDVHTGVNLMRVGFLVRYVPVLVSKGICPSDLSSFLNQQYRWCTGSMSLLADKTFHANAHISFRQRLCFWAGFLYYIATAANAFIAPLPGLVMLYHLPQWIDPINSVWMLGSLTLWLVVVPIMFKSHWRIDVLRVQYLYSFAHAVAIVHVITGRTKEWVATGAVQRVTTPLGTQIARLIRVFVVTSLSVTWIGLGLATYRFGIQELWAMVALAILASYIQIPLLFLATPKKKTRAVTVTAGPPVDRVVPGPLVPQMASATAAESRVDAAKPVVSRPRATPTRIFRPDIQGLRAVAVLLVVLYHAGVPYVPGGYVGVDVFFAISGYLITGQILREIDRTGTFSFRGFWAGRIRRLMPSALIVILVTVVATRLSGSLLRTASVAWDGVLAAVFGMNYRLAAQGVDYQQASGPSSPLQHFWSLAVEEQFYLVWPVIVVLAALVWQRRSTVSVVVAISLALAASFLCSAFLTESNPPLAYFATQTRGWELAAGALMAVVIPRFNRMPRLVLAAMSWLGLIGLIVSAFVYTDETRFPGTAALWPILATCFLIAGGGNFLKGSAEVLLARWPFQVVGRLSYGWYLWHWPVLLIVPTLIDRNFTWVQNLGLMGLALWISALMYNLVESPSARSRWSRFTWAKVGSGMTVLTLAVSLIVAFSVPSLVGQGAAAKAITLSANDETLLQTTLGEGLGLTEAPKNLKPSLEDASDDQPASTQDGCHANYLDIDQGSCIYGDPTGTKTVVLFGDSHMQQWLPAFDAAAKKKKWKVVAWTKAACPIADGVTIYNSSLKRDYTECDEWRAKTIKRIAALSPNLILMSQSDNVPSRQVTNERWSDATAVTALNLEKAGSHVVYILDTPVPKSDAPSCIAAHIDNVAACAQKIEDAYSIAGRHESMSSTLQAAKIQTVDPVDWMCTYEACPVIVQDKLVYRDESHVSTPYSEWLAPFVAPILTTSK